MPPTAALGRRCSSRPRRSRGSLSLPAAALPCLLLSAPAQTWTSLGPAPTTGFAGATGRVSALACHPTDPSLYYAAGADGGVWRTNDAGLTWLPLTDHLPTTAIGALALDPTNPAILYAGSGEANFANHSRPGLGLFKSTDGGDTWTVLGAETFSGRCFSRIVINPQDPQTLYAAITQAGGFPQRAAAKNHPGATGPRGVFRSTDGGHTWARLTTLPDLCATDLALNPQAPSTLYAAIGHIFGHADNGVYRSTDGGDTWARLAGSLPSPPTTPLGRISLAIAPGDPARIAALLTRPASASGGSGTFLNAYLSLDTGQSWAAISPSVDQSSYGWFLSTIAFHPTQPDMIFAGGLNLRRRNATAPHTWSTVTPPHVDQHAVAFDASGRLLAGCDGGVYRSPDLGASWVSLNTGLATIQFYPGLSTSPAPTSADFLIGGTQDNGTSRRISSTLTWQHILGGDGGWTQLNPQNPQIVFAEFQGTGNLYRSTSGGTGFTLSSSGLSGRNCFLPPYLIDPAPPPNPQRMLYATERVFVSTNGGLNWSPLSADLTAGAPAAIRALAIAPSSSAYVYAATNDGRVLSSTDGGATFTLRLTDAGTWPRVTRELTVDPLDPLTVYHAGWTYGPAPRLRRSRDGGATWERLDAGGALPDIPINVVAIDPRPQLPTIFAGADDGVYRSINGGQTWKRYGDTLPRTSVTDLILEPTRPPSGRLTAGTQGRGAWNTPIVFCYPDIDDSGSLNVADFGAFLVAFAAGSQQANCDRSTTPPILNVADFSCYLQAYAAGCP
ncbi:MAG: GC-type dockerin domain-anchored protein [Phycisphaerales bacterium]